MVDGLLQFTMAVSLLSLATFAAFPHSFGGATKHMKDSLVIHPFKSVERKRVICLLSSASGTEGENVEKPRIS